MPQPHYNGSWVGPKCGLDGGEEEINVAFPENSSE